MAKQHTEGTINTKAKRLHEAKLERLFSPSEKLNEEIKRLNAEIDFFNYGIK